jgi:hypothetical protein
MAKDAARAHEESEQLLLACQKVGLFLHKFALLEQEINERIVDLLKLEGVAAVVLLDSRYLSFKNKLEILTLVASEKAPEAEKTDVAEIFHAIDAQNTNRNLMAHCRFEASANESVQFKRPIKVKKQKDPLWLKEQFADETKKLEELRESLKKLRPQLIITIGDDGTSTLIRRFLDDEGPLGPTSSPLHSPALRLTLGLGGRRPQRPARENRR